MVNAYVRVWRGSCAVFAPDSTNVLQGRRQRVEEVVCPWPTIGLHPTAFQEDGRFAKAHPLNFPTGSGDFLQPRVRSDFTAVEWVQHALRFYIGHMQSSLHGHRLLWAAFNTALQSVAKEKGSIVHKRSHADEILTKDALRGLCKERNDLVHQIATWGAEIPTTAMQWHKDSNNLE